MSWMPIERKRKQSSTANIDRKTTINFSPCRLPGRRQGEVSINLVFLPGRTPKASRQQRSARVAMLLTTVHSPSYPHGSQESLKIEAVRSFGSLLITGHCPLLDLDPEQPGRAWSGIPPFRGHFRGQVDNIPRAQGVGSLLQFDVELSGKEIADLFSLVDEKMR
jgi:hypothetical protein